MGVVALLADARRAGLMLRADRDRLVIQGPRLAEPLVRALRVHKPALLALLCQEEPEVQWRLEVWRPYVIGHKPIWLPPVRPEALVGEMVDRCRSCGDPLPQGHRFHCLPCQHARWLVLLEEEAGGLVSLLGGTDAGVGEGSLACQP